MKFKMKFAAVAVATSIIFSPVVNASGIPVADAAHIGQSAANFVIELEKMKEQLQQMKQQYAAITGSRNMGNILTNTGLKEALPQDWQKVYSSIQSGGYKGLDGAAKALADAAQLAKGCNKFKDGTEQKRTCQNAAVRTAQTQSHIEQAINNATQRLQNLRELANKINSATDLKAIQDLQARIAIEQAAIQNEQTRLQLFTKLAEEQEKMARREAAVAAQKAQNDYVEKWKQHIGK